jgi:hypothetical protein
MLTTRKHRAAASCSGTVWLIPHFGRFQEKAHRGLPRNFVAKDLGCGRGRATAHWLPRTRTFPRRGERTLLRAAPYSQANAEPAAQRDSSKACSLGAQFPPELTAIVATFGPPLLQVGEPNVHRGMPLRNLTLRKLTRAQPRAYGLAVQSQLQADSSL